MPDFDNGQRPGLVTPAQEKAAGAATPATAIKNLQIGSSVSAAEEIGNPEKAFATLRAAFALRGHRLERAFHGDSKEPTYYAERWGLVRYLPTLHDVAMFLTQIGGRL